MKVKQKRDKIIEAEIKLTFEELDRLLAEMDGAIHIMPPTSKMLSELYNQLVLIYERNGGR
jgi:hypothetical protein